MNEATNEGLQGTRLLIACLTAQHAGDLPAMSELINALDQHARDELLLRTLIAFGRFIDAGTDDTETYLRGWALRNETAS